MLLPKTIDNTYRGQWLAVPLLAAVVLSKFAMSFNVIFRTQMVIERADGIDLTRYNADALPLILYMFQVWGIGHFLLAALVGVALIRYRSMLPLATLFMLGEQLLRLVLRMTVHLPGVREGAQSLATMPIGVLVSRGLLVAMVLGLILSLWRRRTA